MGQWEEFEMRLFKRLLIICTMLLAMVPGLKAGQYSPAWQNYLAAHSQDHMVGAIITMADQVDLRSLQDHLYAIHADRQLWHQTVMTALQDKATTTQADILAQLADLQAQGQVSHYQGLWVGNVVVVKATPAVLEQLVSRNDVMQVSPDYPIQNIAPVDVHLGNQPTIASVENGLKAIGADSCWAIGITGDGRLVSSLDTGVDGNHVALAARWRGVADSRYIGHTEWAWYDPVTNTHFPFDSGQHGTHTMGTMCGLGAGTGDTVGVAFGAQWIEAGVIDRVSIQRTVQDALTAFQWITDPDGDPATAWDVPDVCSESWGLMSAFGYPACDETFWTVLDGCEAAGVVVNFAAGNEGPGPESLRNPADRATTDTKSFSVGAVDGNQFPDCPIAAFSSRGPSHCTPDSSVTFKPEVTAPGVNVRSCMPGNGYQFMSGTSMATPHVSGAVALIRQANPNLSSEQVHTILMETATDKGAPGEDNDYGAGVINCYQAVLRAAAMLQGWGTLGGVITDQASGLPLAGARVTIQNRAVQLSATSRPDGHYYLFCPADTNWIIKVEAGGHVPIFDTIMVAQNDTLIRNYALEGKVPVTITASFGNPAHCDYRSFYIKGSWNSDGFYDTSWSGPLIEIRDDGQPPDFIAGDGVFTGQILLARNLNHIFQWAIYSENSDSCLLQNGNNFQVLDYTPPDVPTLSVNPSGNYHNWMISVAGNIPGDTLDLQQGYNGFPNRWVGFDSLFVGVQYTLSFIFMHSDAGCHDQPVVFVPDYTALYQFKFNDANNTYLIQPADTLEPPSYLWTDSGLDGHIPVHWLPPGFAESQTLRYDDGELANAYYFYSYDDIMANMFVPSSPCTIDSLMVHTLTNGDPFWPWPDGTHDPVGLSIFLDDGTGMPEADPVFYGEAASGGDGLDIKIDVPEVAASGAFWVGMQNLPGGGDEGMGLDANTDYPGNKWSRINGVWGLESSYNGDQMIYCRVFEGLSSAWLGANPTPANFLASNVPYHCNPKTAHGTGTANPGRSATKIGHSESRLVYHPRTSPVNPPIVQNQEIFGYELYRDSSPYPFERRPGTRVFCFPLNPQTNWDDWVRCNGIDSIQNGVLYYYQVSAVYDIGGPEFLEIVYPGQATGHAENHPPNNPANLQFTVNGRTVTLTWDQNTDYDMAHYGIYRKDYGAQNFHLQGTVDYPVHTFSETINVDGIYSYKIAAIDRGGMQSTGYSNTVNVAIGTIPPRNLRASTDLEFMIHTSWESPGLGGRATTDIGPLLIVASDDATMLSRELMAYGDVERVDFFDARNATPILDDLMPYEAVICWTNYSAQNPTGLGNVLADYVDAGGAVLLTQFCFSAGWGLSGRIMSDYSPFSQGSTQYVQQCLGQFNPDDCEMIGISNVCDNYQASVNLVNGGELIASFQDGTPFVARNRDVRVEAINGYVGDARQFTGQMIDLIHGTLNCMCPGTHVMPDQYKLYKSSAPGGPFTLLVTLPGNLRSYDDRPVPNGVPYWYRVTDVFNGWGESDPTDTARGMAQNLPPPPPFNLEVWYDSQFVHLCWQFDNSVGDLDHFNIYRKDDNGPWSFVEGTRSYCDTVQIQIHGLTMFSVTAVDNGTPPLESNRSNPSMGNLPPANLQATSNQNNVVPLQWSLPGLLPDTLIQYDDGMLANAWYFYDHASFAANQFVANQGAQLDSINVHVLTDGDPYWPWPDPTHDPVLLMVFDDNGNGQPGDMIFSQEAVGEPGRDIKVPIVGGLILNGPNFWIGMTNEAGGGEEGLGVDAVTDYPQYMWYSIGGTWTNGPYYTGDQMIRASIVSHGQSIQLTEKTPTIAMALKNANSPLTTTSSKDNSSKPIGSVHPADIQEMAGFNIYRSTLPNVPIDPAYRIRGYADQGINNTYEDHNVINDTTYFYKVTAIYHFGSEYVESPGSNEASATPRRGGNMPVDPLYFNLFATSHGIVHDTLTIFNQDDLDLNYAIFARVQNRRVLADLSRVNWSFSAARHDNISHLDKSHVVQGPTNPPVIAGSGGPDAYGYSWIDSDEPGGPAVNWIDIEGIGQQLPMHGDDENLGPFDIGFEFPFYGVPFNSFNVCSNGWISFTSTRSDFFDMSLPQAGAPENLIAPFWDDLYLPGGGSIWYLSSDSVCVISWIGVPHYSGGGPYTFQIVLYPNGLIQYNYLDMADPVISASIGWQNGDGSDGLNVVFDADYIHPNMTININAGWLSVFPASGTIPPGGSALVTVTADGTLLADGTYNGFLTAAGYDMNHQINSTSIPVAFYLGADYRPCSYIPGDINGNHSVNGLDIVYAVNYFKGSGYPPPIDCYSYCQTDPDPFFAAGDVNGNCVFNGIDITYFVRYLRGQVPSLQYCPNCIPGNLILPAPAVEPIKAPLLKSPVMNNQDKSK
jgi:subtilisin family serine protease